VKDPSKTSWATGMALSYFEDIEVTGPTGERKQGQRLQRKGKRPGETAYGSIRMSRGSSQHRRADCVYGEKAAGNKVASDCGKKEQGNGGGPKSIDCLWGGKGVGGDRHSGGVEAS